MRCLRPNSSCDAPWTISSQLRFRRPYLYLVEALPFLSSIQSRYLRSVRPAKAMIPNDQVTFEVQIKTLEGLPSRSVVRSLAKRRWRACLDVGPVLERTAPVSRSPDGLIVWNETFTFTTPTKDRSSARLALYRAHGGANDEKIAEANNLDLVEISKVKELTVNLLDVQSRDKSYGRLVIQARVQLPKVELPLALAKAAEQPVSQLCKMTSIPQPWQRFLTAFQQAIELARQISELDPTAKAAVGVISFALMAVVKQIERDQRVSDLREMMTSLLLFFRDIESVRKSPFLRDVLDRTLRQVSECTYFILQYQEIETFVQRTAVHLTSDTDGVLAQFFGVFATLKAELALGTSLQTAINTDFILNKVKDIDAFLHINRLDYLKESGWQADKQCPPFVRDFTINRIHRWISSFEQGLFVLAGPPGSGKSAILHSVAGVLDKRKRLGAGIFLREETQGRRTAKMLMRTVIHYLAMSNTRVGARIAFELSQHPSLDSADATRYGELLEAIGRDLVLYGPLVVVVDGLHELDTAQDQKLVQSILAKVATSSYDKLRFIISSRDVDATSQSGSVFWEIGMPLLPPSAKAAPSPEALAVEVVGNFPVAAATRAKFANLSDPISLAGYDPQELTPLLHKYSLGSSQWISVIQDVLESLPQYAKAFLDELLTSLPLPQSEDAAIQGILNVKFNMLPLSIFDYDFLHAPPGSTLFVSGSTKSPFLPNKLLHQFGLLQAETDPLIQNPRLKQCHICILQSLPGFPGPHCTPFLPVESPLSIYQICLREASEVGQGPVYARIALPATKLIRYATDLRSEFQWYGVDAGAFIRMAADPPLEGCEWLILHQELFKPVIRDGCTTLTVTTPVITQAILERFVCIWVYWAYSAEGDCTRFRDGNEETGFLGNHCFTNVDRHGTHSELSDDTKRRGDLRVGDRIQVRAKYKGAADSKRAILAMALKY